MAVMAMSAFITIIEGLLRDHSVIKNAILHYGKISALAATEITRPFFYSFVMSATYHFVIFRPVYDDEKYSYACILAALGIALLIYGYDWHRRIFSPAESHLTSLFFAFALIGYIVGGISGLLLFAAGKAIGSAFRPSPDVTETLR
jgi:hypothetical protein